MNYYEPVFHMLPVTNTTPSSFKFIRFGDRKTKFGIAYTTLLLVIITGYKTLITGSENKSNNLDKRS
jgi:hypothetical protein